MMMNRMYLLSLIIKKLKIYYLEDSVINSLSMSLLLQSQENPSFVNLKGKVDKTLLQKIPQELLSLVQHYYLPFYDNTALNLFTKQLMGLCNMNCYNKKCDHRCAGSPRKQDALGKNLSLTTGTKCMDLFGNFMYDIKYIIKPVKYDQKSFLDHYFSHQCENVADAHGFSLLMPTYACSSCRGVAMFVDCKDYCNFYCDDCLPKKTVYYRCYCYDKCYCHIHYGDEYDEKRYLSLKLCAFCMNSYDHNDCHSCGSQSNNLTEVYHWMITGAYKKFNVCECCAKSTGYQMHPNVTFMDRPIDYSMIDEDDLPKFDEHHFPEINTCENDDDFLEMDGDISDYDFHVSNQTISRKHDILER